MPPTATDHRRRGSTPDTASSCAAAAARIMLDKLWAIISTPDIRWLLVVQDIYRIDPPSCSGVAPPAGGPATINIRHPAAPVARQLIVDLSTRHEFHLPRLPTPFPSKSSTGRPATPISSMSFVAGFWTGCAPVAC